MFGIVGGYPRVITSYLCLITRYIVFKGLNMWYSIKDGLIYFRCRNELRAKKIYFIYNNETEQEIENFISYYENSNNRIRNIINSKYKLKIDELLYMGKVYDLTESNCSIVNGIEKRGADYHLDHIVPVRYGYKKQIPIELMASAENLQILSKTDNIKKGNKITNDALILLKKWGYE